MDSDTKLSLLESFPANSYEEWLQAVQDSLKGADFDKVMKTKTYEGIILNPIYRMEDIEDILFTDNLPGTAPYLRGNDSQRFMERGWLVAQAQYNPDLKELNNILLKELQQGLTAINLKLKHDDTNRGLKLESVYDLETAFKGIDLFAAPLLIQMDCSDKPLLPILAEYLQKQGMDIRNLEAGIGYDPSSEFARKGYISQGFEETWEFIYQTVLWTVKNAPKIRCLSIDGGVYEAAGANSALELGFVLSTAIGYIEGLTMKGLTIEEIAPLFQVRLTLGSNFFMEMAKIRAFRLLWAEMISTFGGSETAQKIWIHGQTASFNKSIHDQYVNVLRTATEGFAGVIGGVDSLEIACFDDLTNLPDEPSRRMARNQQIILNEEAHFGKVVDPAGGCYYLEWLTKELATKAWSIMQDLETTGGMIKSLRTGRIHKMVEESANARIEAVNKRKDIFVGINMYANPLEQCSCNTEQIASHGIKAVVLEKGALPKRRAMQDLESLRMKVEAVGTEKITKIFLLNMGSIAEYKARADFATGFFQVGGFEVISPYGFTSVEEAVKAAGLSGATAYCICSTDDKYISLVPELCKRLPDKLMILAGYPTEMVQTYQDAGVKLFIHLRADVHQTLSKLANELGVR